ncbi:MAG: biotin/lipoyl-containing protein, partial [Armatimonadota bacterium]
MNKFDVDIDTIKKLVELTEKYHLQELSVDEADLSITVKGKSIKNTQQVIVNTPNSTQSSAEVYENLYIEHDESFDEIALEENDENVVNIVSPLVGVFYRAPSPDAPPFVEIGDVIEVGTEIGLIEAMKVFSPIPSEVAGEIVEICVSNGKLVQQGDV